MSISFPDEIAGFSFFPLRFDKKSDPVDDSELAAISTAVTAGDVTDLFVLSHGWNNHIPEALSLYKKLLTSVEATAAGRLDGRKVAVLGIFWPSKKFADKELTSGGAASLDQDLPTDDLLEEIEDLKGVFDAGDADEVLDRLKDLVPALEDDPDVRRKFTEEALTLLGDLDDELTEEIPQELFSIPGEKVIERLSVPARQGEAARGAVGFNPFKGMVSGAKNLLNLLTFWKMKKRAGEVGMRGLAPVIQQLRKDSSGLKLHLVGHSFGGRLVSAAARGEMGTDPNPRIASMTLLQAAFSHHAFAENYKGDRDGFFRIVLADHRVAGPVLITHTSNDLPNSWAYPAASRLAVTAQGAAALGGGANDPHGSIGRNGAQSTPNTHFENLLAVGATYSFTARKVYNLKASQFIKGHSDVKGPEVAHAIVSAVVTT